MIGRDPYMRWSRRITLRCCALLELSELVFKAHRLLYHSTLGSRVMKMKDDYPLFSSLLLSSLERQQMPGKWLQERSTGSKNDPEIPPRRASRGSCEVSRGEKMAPRVTDQESYITESALIYEDDRLRVGLGERT